MRFHRDYEKTFRLTGAVHQLMYGQISQQRPPIHEKIIKAEMATAIEDKHQIKTVEEARVRHITPIKVKEEPSTQYAVIDLTDKEDLPDVPTKIFNHPLKLNMKVTLNLMLLTNQIIYQMMNH